MGQKQKAITDYEAAMRLNTGDLYVELSDLVRSSRLIENVDFYLHIGEAKHSGQLFPIFYVPFTAERTEQGFNINAEPRLYVNKRAMDYVAQEVARDYKRCKKCDRDLPMEMFSDNSTKSGFGRLCRECKTTTPSTYRHPKFRRRYRRW